MNTQIQVFIHPQFGEIRTMTLPNGQVGFVGNDVAKVLGYSNYRNAIANHVDGDDKLRTQIEYAGQKREVTCINESGLYSLILSSKLPKAREFKHWVTSEVLPQIRKTGGYIPVTKADDEKTIMARAMQIMMKTIDVQQQSIETQRHKLAAQADALANLQPKAEYCDEVLDSVSCMTTTQVAKGLGMTAVELNHLLCQQRVQYGQSGQYMLYADYAHRGFAQNRTHAYSDVFDRTHTRSYLVWTERGRQFITSLVNQMRQVRPAIQLTFSF